MTKISLANKNIKIHYNFENLTPGLESDIEALVVDNLQNKMDAYLNKVLSKKDSEGLIDIRITKNKQEKYEGSFEFVLDGIKYMYQNNSPFRDVIDLVNHAFDHLKETLADKPLRRERWVKVPA